MPRLSLAAALPPLLVAVLVALFLHRWTERPDTPVPPPTTAAAREAAGIITAGGPAQPAAANSSPPQAIRDPAPAGTPDSAPTSPRTSAQSGG